MAVLFMLYVLAGVASLGLNLFVASLLRNEGFRNLSSRKWIILNIVVADLAQTVISYPTELYVIYGNRLMEGIECNVFGFVLTLTSLVSVCLLTGLTVERAVILSYAMKVGFRNLGENNWYCLYVIIPSWFYALFWAIAPLFGWSSYVQSTESKICSFDLIDRNKVTLSYIYSILVGCYVIPLTIMLISFWKGRHGFATLGAAFLRNYGNSSQEPPLSSIIGRKDEIQEPECADVNHNMIDTGIVPNKKQVSFHPVDDSMKWNRLQKMYSIECFAMVVMFLVMWTPYGACVLIQLLVGDVSAVAMSVSAYIGKFKTIMDPIIYLVFLQKE